MNEWLSGSILALYYLILGTLACYGTHRLVLVITYWRTRRDQRPIPESPARWPVVTVQLPIFNEMYVAERLIEAVCRLDYPRDRLEVQVLDDSTDETREIIAQLVARLKGRGFDIHHLHRVERPGFKAGALEAGLQVARGELVAVFDADFVPNPEFLRRSVPHFADAEVGMVQARWGHLNRDYSLLTRAQAILLDGHFMVEHAARDRGGCFFNFNGTAGLWRRQAIEQAGGWEHDTLTEDLDLSYRSQLAGWKFLYLPDLVVPAELPAEINAYKSQQNRWAKGSVQTARKLLATVLRAPVPFKVKFEAFVHLTANSTYLLMVFLSLLIFPAMVLRRGDEAWKLLAFDLPLFTMATVSVLLFFAVSQQATGAIGWRRRLWQLPAVMGLGIGLAINNARAVVSGFFQDGGVFHRTPKYCIEQQGDGWAGKKYRLPYDITFYIESFLAFYFVICFGVAIELEMWLSMPFLYLFLHGYVHMFLLGVAPLMRGRRLRAAEAV
ncbi:MAG: glycosyltransferase [bacterium]|nr:glycosyltransferase [bacterium]